MSQVGQHLEDLAARKGYMLDQGHGSAGTTSIGAFKTLKRPKSANRPSSARPPSAGTAAAPAGGFILQGTGVMVTKQLREQLDECQKENAALTEQLSAALDLLRTSKDQQKRLMEERIAFERSKISAEAIVQKLTEAFQLKEMATKKVEAQRDAAIAERGAAIQAREAAESERDSAIRARDWLAAAPPPPTVVAEKAPAPPVPVPEPAAAAPNPRRGRYRRRAIG